jgi:hypothetical protein
MTDATSLVEAFARLAQPEQDYVLAELAKRVIAGHNGAANITLTDPDGGFVGYLFGAKRSIPNPRPRTAEEEAEAARRLRNRHDAVSAEEIMDLVRTAENRRVVDS